jgi:hypothetical protein
VPWLGESVESLMGWPGSSLEGRLTLLACQ